MIIKILNEWEVCHYSIPMGLLVPQETHLNPQRGQVHRGCCLHVLSQDQSNVGPLLATQLQPRRVFLKAESLWAATSHVTQTEQEVTKSQGWLGEVGSGHCQSAPPAPN